MWKFKVYVKSFYGIGKSLNVGSCLIVMCEKNEPRHGNSPHRRPCTILSTALFLHAASPRSLSSNGNGGAHFNIMVHSRKRLFGLGTNILRQRLHLHDARLDKRGSRA